MISLNHRCKSNPQNIKKFDENSCLFLNVKIYYRKKIFRRDPSPKEYEFMLDTGSDYPIVVKDKNFLANIYYEKPDHVIAPRNPDRTPIKDAIYGQVYVKFPWQSNEDIPLTFDAFAHKNSENLISLEVLKDPFCFCGELNSKKSEWHISNQEFCLKEHQ